MIRTLALALALGAVGGATLASAEDEAKHPLPPLEKQFPLGQTFSLRELNGKPVSADLDVSLKIDSSLRGSGFGGCNSYSAVMYPQLHQHLAVGPFAMTHKACDKESQAIENGFLSSLLGNPSWDLVNGDLVIKGPRGAARLVRSL